MDIQAILVILYCLIYKIQMVELSRLPCLSNQYKHNGFCCNKCGPGTFVLNHCTNTTQTICETCKDGTFSSAWTSKEDCTSCSNYRCPQTMRHTQICNSTVNNKCGCIKPDQFYNFARGSCTNCRRCKVGEYPVKPCTEETHCTPCPENYFSNTSLNYGDKCMKCTECKLYESMCTSTKDAVCRRELKTTPQVKTTTFFTEKSTRATEEWKPTGSNSSNPKGSNSKKQIVFSNKMIAVMIVAIVIVAFLIGAMVYWRTKKATDRNRCAGFSSIEEPVDTCQRTFSFGDLLLRDQPAKVILGLHSLLNPESPNNWRTLAAELEVQYLQILNYENNLNTAAKEMLHSWGTSDSGTLNRLYLALRKIGRDDACEFLEENVEIPEREETLV